MAEEKQMTYDETTYYNIRDIREAVDIVIGDDGFRSKETIEVLKHFKHIHFPMILDVKCEAKHDEEG